MKGEWSKFIYADNELLWDYSQFAHYELKYTKFTLPSDSTLREDLKLLKTGNEEAASEAKLNLEEIQRRDRKLRAQTGGSSH
jgi:hypothetical protein